MKKIMRKKMSNRQKVIAKNKRIMKTKVKRLWKNIFGTSLFALFSLFGWMIVRGTIELLPDIAGGTLIIIGITGLSVLGYLGLKK